MLVDSLVRYIPVLMLLLLGLAVSLAAPGRRSPFGAAACASLLIAETARLTWIGLFHHYSAEQPSYFHWLRPTISWTGSTLEFLGIALFILAIYRARRPEKPVVGEIDSTVSVSPG